MAHQPDIPESTNALLRKLDRGSHESLSAEEARAFYDALQESRVLEMDTIDPGTLERIGRLMYRADADADRQAIYLDDFPGLWSRIGIDVDPVGLANLEDRIARKAHKPQIFGTLPNEAVDGSGDDVTRRYAAARDMIGIDRSLQIQPMSNPAPLALIPAQRVTQPALRKEILRLAKLDQDARREPADMNADQEKAFMAHLSTVDAYTLPRTRSIFSRYGIPAPSQVGRAATHGMFLLIQHAIDDPGLMRAAVAPAESLFKRGDLPAIDYALLTDRVDCVIDRRPQLYGTQGTRKKSSHWYCPIAKPEGVNLRRREINLAPMTEADIYGADGDRSARR